MIFKSIDDKIMLYKQIINTIYQNTHVLVLQTVSLPNINNSSILIHYYWTTSSLLHKMTLLTATSANSNIILVTTISTNLNVIIIG